MSLEPYQRGGQWWARGYVEDNGQRITGYIRESTGASTEAGAKRWAREREERERRRLHVGDEGLFTFADAVMLYTVASPSDARRLAKVLPHLAATPVREIAPAAVRELGPLLYPRGCADTWRRAVIAPVRAVINHAHDRGKCPPIKIKGYDEDARLAQDKKRGKVSRTERRPGSWEWLLRFREHASQRHAALALFLFTTGARLSQALAMHPEEHLDLQNGRVCVPGAKGSADRWLLVPPELIVELANLAPRVPRGWSNEPENLRVFGWADRSGPYKGWTRACRLAGIERLMPHSAGRHGYGQEMNVRQRVDEKAAGAFGGWKDLELMRRTYTHAEGVEGKIHEAWRTGRVQAEQETGLLLMRTGS